MVWVVAEYCSLTGDSEISLFKDKVKAQDYFDELFESNKELIEDYFNEEEDEEQEYTEYLDDIKRNRIFYCEGDFGTWCIKMFKQEVKDD